jgi:CHAT domain-containing protein
MRNHHPLYQWVSFKVARMGQYVILASLAMFLCIGMAVVPPGQALSPQTTTVLQSAVAAAIEQAIALSDQSLQYQQQGDWDAAETAIHQAMAQLDAIVLSEDLDTEAYAIARAHAQDVEGQLFFHRGQFEAALSRWQTSAEQYDALGDRQGVRQSQLNQALALRELRFYPDAVEQLERLYETLSQADANADPEFAIAVLSTLADTQTRLGDTDAAQATLLNGFSLLGEQSPEFTVSLSIQQAQIAQQDNNLEEALEFYAQALSKTSSSLSQVQIRLQQLQIWNQQNNWEAIAPYLNQMVADLNDLPIHRDSIYARLNYAQTAMQWLNQTEAVSLSTVSNLLSQSVQDARQLGDRTVESYSLGILAKLYQQNEQWTDAAQLTQAAITLTEQINAPELSYQWYWQLGQILSAQGDSDRAIAAYSTSITLLQTLRQDLIITNPVVQASFQDTIEPIHRELASLLLITDRPENVSQARDVLESLQISQLNNFLQQTCLDATSVVIDQVDERAAVLYPVILPDRLEVILSLPNQPLQHYSTAIPPAEVEATVQSYLSALTTRFGRFNRSASVQLYDWLLRPIESQLSDRGIQTLVFVPDGVLRNVPMAALYDGTSFLIEHYAVAVTPSLQLFESSPLDTQDLSVLVAGLSEARQDFSSLPFVESEVSTIAAILPTQVLLNQEFTRPAVTNRLSETSFPIVHLATHGEFGGSLDDTFILTWDDRININQLDRVLQASDINRETPIELLVLSACQTATGDRYAALGLAGVAVQAGARSTLASLWFVNDEATAALMQSFYQKLTESGMSRAKALQQAQKQLLSDRAYDHPYYWSAFILVGSWL